MAEQAQTFTWPGGRPKLTHMGINVIDLEKMVAFYTRIMGLTVSDRGFSPRLQCNMAFMTSDPAEHHQLVMLETRPADSVGNVNQISFKVSSLDELRGAFDRLADEGIEARPIDHGNAWSIYFPDPEGNDIEIYLSSPFYVPQPHGAPLDLGKTNDEIVRGTEERIKGDAGFKTGEAWAADIAEKMRG